MECPTYKQPRDLYVCIMTSSYATRLLNKRPRKGWGHH